MHITLLLAGLLLSLGLEAQESAAEKTLKQLAGSATLKDAVWGVVAKDASGNNIISYNGNKMMMPASNIKLVTSGAALHVFGPEYRFKTGLAYSGSIGEDGTLDGDLYILGGGDPTIGSKDSIAMRPEATFWRWKTMLTKAGVKKIGGRIIGDGSSWEGNLEHYSWDYADTGTYYGTGSNSLCFYQNTIDLEVSASEEGKPVNMRQRYPRTPWLQIENLSQTAAAGTGNSLYLFTTDVSPYAQLRGTYAKDRKPKIERAANKFGALTCAYYFRENLISGGWEVAGGYAFVGRGGNIIGPDFASGGPASKELKPLGESEGPELRLITRECNVRSDNFYAESLLRAMGEASCGVAVYDSCLVAIKDVLLDLGLLERGYRQVDGSGLSRMNYISPEWMASFLYAMQKSPAFDAFLSSLPQPGEGTLRGLPANPRLRMKSGSMDGILCYSGYILGDDGKPATSFSIFTNNTTATQAEVRSALVRLLLALDK